MRNTHSHKGNRTGKCSNHRSYFDPVFLGIKLKRQLRFMAKDSLFHKPVLGDGHAGHAEVRLAGLYGGDDGVKLHVLDLQVIAQQIADGLGHVGVDAHDVAAFVILIGREGGVGRHRQRFGHGRAHQQHGKNQQHAHDLLHGFSLQICARSRLM